MNSSTIVFGCTAEKLILVDKTREKTSNWIDLQCFCPSLILIKFSVVYWSSMDATTQITMLMWYDCMCNGPAHWITIYQENRIKTYSILFDCISSRHSTKFNFSACIFLLTFFPFAKEYSIRKHCTENSVILNVNSWEKRANQTMHLHTESWIINNFCVRVLCNFAISKTHLNFMHLKGRRVAAH